MFTRIMVPTDGSAAAMAAVDTATALARATGAEIVGLHVLPLRAFGSRVAGVLAASEREALANAYLGYVDQRAAQAGVRARVLTRTADASHEAIVKAARDLQCDLIVMGSRGLGGVEAMLLGSQTQAVLTHSAIPVMVVPPAAATR